MIPKKHRFTTRVGEDFFANAKRAYSPLFVLYFQKREDDLVKTTVIVPKKHALKATERSKIKRKMREALKQIIPSLEGFRIVLYLKRRTKEEDFANFNKEVYNLINEINEGIF